MNQNLNANQAESDPLQVYILTNDINKLSEDYIRIFTQQPGFADPIFSGIQYPDQKWLSHFTKYMDQNDAIQVYNHYLIWLQTLENDKPNVILYNRSYPTQPDKIMGELIKVGQLITDIDILFYGKYLDRCDQYKYNRTVVITNDQMSYKFPLYQTFSPYGVFAYLITPSGAQKLITELTYNPAPTEIMANRLIEKGILNALTYHPSIIRLNDDDYAGYECREPEHQKSSLTWGKILWYLLIFIVIGLIIGAIIYFLSINLTYNPNREISAGFELPRTENSIESQSQSVQSRLSPNSKVQVEAILSPSETTPVFRPVSQNAIPVFRS